MSEWFQVKVGLHRGSVHSPLLFAIVVDALTNDGIIDSYWFEVENERTQKVNMEHYVEVLTKFWASLGQCEGYIKKNSGSSKMGPPPPII